MNVAWENVGGTRHRGRRYAWYIPLSSLGSHLAAYLSRPPATSPLPLFLFLSSPSSHPALAKVAFTGSTATGRRVALAAAENLRPATCELGGKSALIIFDDADLDKAVEWVMFGAFWTNGQICSSTSRVLIHER